jgi:hypothetical protein
VARESGVGERQKKRSNRRSSLKSFVATTQRQEWRRAWKGEGKGCADSEASDTESGVESVIPYIISIYEPIFFYSNRETEATCNKQFPTLVIRFNMAGITPTVLRPNLTLPSYCRCGQLNPDGSGDSCTCWFLGKPLSPSLLLSQSNESHDSGPSPTEPEAVGIAFSCWSIQFVSESSIECS